ncbi:MAG: type II toxin-antitoxin system RelE/ParE family toxin [Gammaproteobacteria bacterium]|nr:type II toxin-antitoxin system RelE/ParE family toxin [Gammaproteobacteria bacterium]
MKLIFRPEAETELLEARAWYEARSSGLGFKFARAADAALESALRMPFAHPRIEGEFRHILLRRFPYSIICHPSLSELVVVSCFHHRRKPGSWLGRIRG